MDVPTFAHQATTVARQRSSFDAVRTALEAGEFAPPG